MEEPRFGDHFTSTDRERLITTSVDLRNLAREFGELKRSIDSRERDSEADDKAIDERIRALENFRWWILGASAGCGALFGLLGSKFLHP